MGRTHGSSALHDAARHWLLQAGRPAHRPRPGRRLAGAAALPPLPLWLCGRRYAGPAPAPTAKRGMCPLSTLSTAANCRPPTPPLHAHRCTTAACRSTTSWWWPARRESRAPWTRVRLPPPSPAACRRLPLTAGCWPSALSICRRRSNAARALTPRVHTHTHTHTCCPPPSFLSAFPCVLVPAEGDSIDFDSLVSQLIELVLALVGNTRWQGMLRGQLQHLLHLTLGYMQMTAAQVRGRVGWMGWNEGAESSPAGFHRRGRLGGGRFRSARQPTLLEHTCPQVERWSGDPNQYVADEEDDFSTVRCGGGGGWGPAPACWACDGVLEHSNASVLTAAPHHHPPTHQQTTHTRNQGCGRDAAG